MEDNFLEALVKPNDKSSAFKEVSEKLAEKSKEAQELRSLIDNLDYEIKNKRDYLRRIEEEEMPALMDEIGVNSITLTNGTRIFIDTSLHASIQKQNEEEAFHWLRQQGHGDLIKNVLTVKFNRNEDNYVGEIKEKIEGLGLHYDQKESVHSMTLKAWVKEQMKQGAQLPAQLFDIFIKRVVNTK